MNVTNTRVTLRRVIVAVLTGAGLTNFVFASVVTAENGAVASRSPLASEAGVQIMRDGGNAIDAAVGTAFALAVTYPSAGNLGGGGFMVIRLADGTTVTNDHREVAPQRAFRDMFLDEEGNYDGDRALRSHWSSGVPGSVCGLLDVHARFGKLPLDQLLSHAIRLAEEGFELPNDIARQFAARKERWLKHAGSAAVFLKEDGEVYEAGEAFVQADLASTLKRITKNGKDGFYRGATADLIVAEMTRGGGLMSHDDLAGYRSVWRDPIHGTYRGHEIFTMAPPSSGGVLVVQMLNALELFPLSDMGYGSAAIMQLMVEVERRAYADRAEHLGDMDFYPVPIAMLTDKSYAKQRMSDYDAARASISEDIKHGTVQSESEETTHLSVIDVEGNAVAYTTTINSGYGSGIVVTGAGFLLNNEMDDFSSKPGTPNQFGLVGAEANAIAPGKRMLSSMTPTIVVKDEKPVLITGSPGGSTIITTVLQVIVNVIDHRMGVEEAVASPRFHHQWRPDSISVETDGFSADVLLQLEEKGYLEIYERRSIGDANSIGIHDGKVTAVSDPRNAGGAASY